MAGVKKAFTFSCPKCDKTLRTANRPVEGRKIKCPACGKPFVPELDDDEEVARIQEKPNLKTKAKTNASKAGAKQRRADPDEDDDERPANRKTPAKKSSGASMIIILLLVLVGGGMFVSLGLCGVGAFVWPGFLKSDDKKLADAGNNTTPETKKTENETPKKTDDAKPADDANKDKDANDKGAGAKDKDDAKKDKKKDPEVKPLPAVTKNNKPEDYVLERSQFLVGANLRTLRDIGQLEKIVAKLEESSPEVAQGLKEFRDLVRSTDQVLVSGQAGQGELKFVVAILTSNAQSMSDFKKRINVPAEKLADRFDVYRADKDGQKLNITFPGDRLVLFSNMEDADFTDLLEIANNKAVRPSPASALRKGVDNAHLWGTYAFDDSFRKLIEDPDDDLKKQAPQSVAAAEALRRARGGSFAFHFTSSVSGSVKLSVECESPGDAKKLIDGGVAIVNALRKEFEDRPGSAPPSLMRDFNSIRLQTQGTTVSLTMTGSVDTIKDLAPKEVAGKDFPPPKDGVRKDFPPGPKDLASKDGPPPAPKDSTIPPVRKDLVAKDGPFPPKDFKLPKDLAQKDANPFPKDIMPKDFPLPKDGMPKDGGFPKFGQPLVDATLTNLAVNAPQERSFKLKQGQGIRVVEFDSFAQVKKVVDKKSMMVPAIPDVRIEILRGEFGDAVVAQGKRTGLSNTLEFTAPADDTYRIRVRNFGPGIVPTAKVIVSPK